LINQQNKPPFFSNNFVLTKIYIYLVNQSGKPVIKTKKIY